MNVTLTKEEYRKLKNGEKLEKDGHTYSRLAKLDGELVTIAEREGDEIGFIAEVKREK